MKGARAISVAGEVLITLGVLVLLFVGWELWWTDVTANRAQSSTVSALENDFADHSSTSVRPDDAIPGQAFAILRIPRFGAGYAKPVYLGTDHDTLTKGVGQYLHTAEPGEIGNFAVAGHRTTYGRPFNQVQMLRNGDVIIVETAQAYVVYRVSSHEIVDPSDTAVIAAVPDQVGATASKAYLTMTTCHPEYSARQRYVVHALLLRSYPRDTGLPRALLTVPAKGP